MCGFIAQLVEHRIGIAEVTGSNPVEALIFFHASFFQVLKLEIYCDDHSSLSVWSHAVPPSLFSKSYSSPESLSFAQSTSRGLLAITRFPNNPGRFSMTTLYTFLGVVHL